MKQKKINYAFILLLSLNVYLCYSFSITESPVCTKVIPSHANIYQLYVGEKARTASLSGIAWFHKRYLAITNLPDEAIYTYLFDENKKILTPIQEITNKQGAQLGCPEHLSVSPDGTLLAVSNCNGTINIYSVDLQTHLINPLPIDIFKLPENEKGPHGIKFSSTGNYLSVTGACGGCSPGLVCIYRVENTYNKKPNLVLTCILYNSYAPTRPKAIDFSSDDEYVVIAYTYNPSSTPRKSESLLAIHRFDKTKGIIEPNHVCIKHVDVSNLEDVKFFSDDLHIITVDQYSDTAVIYEFDKISSNDTEQLRKKYEKEIKELHQYVKCGMKFAHGEGDWYLKESNSFLVKIILLHFNFELKDYIVFLSEEYRHNIAEDAALAISWDELRKRIIRWERFAKKHPTLEEVKSEILPQIERMLLIYLLGMDNTRIYDWGKNKLKVALKNSYESFIKRNTGSSYHNIIKTVYEIYEKHNFHINDEVVNFISSEGFRVPNLLPKKKRR